MGETEVFTSLEQVLKRFFPNSLPPGRVTCPACQGSTYAAEDSLGGHGTCAECDGKGHVPCPHCSGPRLKWKVAA